MSCRMLLVLCFFCPSCHALGTLFYSADERTEQASNSIYAVEGIVERSDGKNSAWINGRSVDEGDSLVPGLSILDGHVLINGIPVKVGETIDISSGKRIDRLPGIKVLK